MGTWSLWALHSPTLSPAAPHAREEVETGDSVAPHALWPGPYEYIFQDVGFRVCCFFGLVVQGLGVRV